MKIEKGKLYYSISGGNVIKSAIDWTDESGDFTDKIAAHCPDKDDIDYIGTHIKLKDDVKKIDEVYGNNICISLDDKDWFLKGCAKQTMQRYQVITIEQFKQFYNMKAQKEPQYFAISKEEWQEYQDLKLKFDKPIEILGCIMNNLDDFNTEQEFKPERYDNYQLVTSDYRLDVFKANLLGFTDDILFFGHWNSGKVK